MRRRLIAALAFAVAACGRPELVSHPDPATIDRFGALSVLSTTPAGLKADARPLRVRASTDRIRCERFVDGGSISFITFERKGDKQAYGVYALWREKNPMSVDRPLAGNPIAWEALDAAAALARLLAQAGLPRRDAADALDRARGDWFGAGARVFMVVRQSLAPKIVPDAAPPAGVLLVVVELDR
ncbi:MAG: hypothetical protein OER88_09545 [Planctomycetota bacterium]|nr:hypothetical protein [Planctomycetota bacterium]